MSLLARYRFNNDLKDAMGGADLVPSGGSMGWSADGIGGTCVYAVSRSFATPVIPPYTTSDISYSGWFWFPKSAMAPVIEGASVTASATTPTGNLIGNDSYGGLGLIWYSNQIYKDGSTKNSLTNIYVRGNIRSNNQQPLTEPAINVPFDGWHHLALTYSQTNKKLKVYLDGALASQCTVQANDSTLPSRAVNINWGAVWGGNGPGMSVPMYICEARIYDHALSDYEVWDLSKGLFLHYDFNNGLSESTTNIVAGTRSAGYNLEEYNVETWATTVAGVSGRNGIYTFRAYIKNTSDHPLNVRLSCYNAAGTSYNALQGNSIASGAEGYSEITCNTTDTSQFNGTINLFIQNGNSGSVPTNKKFYLKEVQFEEKDHSTPFTPTSRTGILSDKSGNLHDATAVGNPPRIIGDSPLGSAYCNLKTGGQYYALGTGALNSLRQGTICFWAKYDSSDYKMIFGSNDSGARYFMACTPNGSSSGGNWYNGTCTASTYYCDGVVNTKPIIDNKWHFYAVTGLNFANWGNYSVYLCIYTSPTNAFQFHGYLADLKIYARNLTQAEIQSLQNTRGAVDREGALYCNYFVEDTSNVSSMLEATGVKTSKTFAETMQLSDGSYWLPIMYHNVATGVFSSTVANLDAGAVFEDSERWANFQLIKTATRVNDTDYEFLVLQQEGTNKTWHTYRFRQTVNPFTATWNDVNPSQIGTKVFHISGGGTYGGTYRRAGNEYMNFANSTNGNWFGWGQRSFYQTGNIPGYNGQLVYGIQIVYLRISQSYYQELTNSITYAKELKEEI